ncbi:MAG: signal recognition particle protein [Phycisphaeraceae bacterium]|nr:signal recognition particle protein [Phycisphaeraceae bacterium]|tara:strand:+ start:1231 stop:2721 length:1491 start_codon:yes stop_codon:yes gene_type:complete
MFESLTSKFNDAFRSLSGRGRISESNIHEAMEQVRGALLEADVHYEVVESFIQSVTQKALGEQVLESLKPGQQMIKVVHDSLVDLMGSDEDQPGLMFVQPAPTIVMMCGLQGSGKTTTCGKLAALLKKQDRHVMLCAADLQRPAAVHQLQVLASQVQEEVSGAGSVHFYGEPAKVAEYGKAVGVAVKVCANAVKAAKDTGCDVLILDTAGRLHINDDLMGELGQINRAVGPHQIFLVTDAMTGQDAVNSAKAFNEQLELDGVVLTKFDSDTRGGAALTVKQITGKPIKFIGTGEKLDALEAFHPDRMASRILGMGDVVSLVEKAQEQVSEEEAVALQEKMAKGNMTMDDFLAQLKNMRRMGSMKNLLGMLPGIGGQLGELDLDDREMNRTEAIIQSMTVEERQDVGVLNHSRRRRIAQGSGTETQNVSQLVKGFGMVSQMGKQMSSMSMMQRVKAMAGMGQMDLAALGAGKGAPRLSGGGTKKAKPKYKQRKRKRR